MKFCGIDSPDSENYQPAASAIGLGSCNNSIRQSQTTVSPFQGYSNYDDGNVSRRLRMMNTSFDPSNTANQSLLGGITATQCSTVAKNYVDTTTNAGTTGIIYYILATIPMSVIHPIFKALPLTKNMYMKLDFTFNTNISTALTIPNGTAQFSAMATSGNAPTCPFMISPIGAAAVGTSTGLVIAAPTAEKIATISIQIAKNTNSHQLTCCRIYVASYTLSPIQEED